MFDIVLILSLRSFNIMDLDVDLCLEVEMIVSFDQSLLTA